MSRSLLRLVHNRPTQKRGVPYRVSIALTPYGAPVHQAATRITVDERGPRVFVLGSGPRLDLGVPGGLLPRHLVVLTYPVPEGVMVRAICLHPERTLQCESEGKSFVAGSVESVDHLDARVNGYRLTVDATLAGAAALPAPEGVLVHPPGEQLGFYANARVKPVGNVLSSISGPEGGHAIPALVAGMGSTVKRGSLVLRARAAVHVVTPSDVELRRGLLVGRSRRCVLGRGFDENDGLSRLHALVIRLGDGDVYLFDLASRYGIRDVSKPSITLQAARLDDGVGCLVYGAGHLVFEEE